MIALGGLLCVGCLGPHTTGGLWAQQNLEQELAQFRLTDAQRVERATVYELGVADEMLAADKARVEAALKSCLGTQRQALGLSEGDRVRDGVRLRIGADATRSTTLAQVALADWYVRRAAASGDVGQCQRARAALGGAPQAEPSASTLLAELGRATVSRDASAGNPAGVAPPTTDALTLLDLYASGYLDVVTATAPLPQYLAAV
ncbi:MAG TPA: hypothetical protein VGQ62_12690, partial [Chloroflexota bacterium]|nr:hypothetical protein [Chloroflexota bacterium]